MLLASFDWALSSFPLLARYFMHFFWQMAFFLFEYSQSRLLLPAETHCITLHDLN